jgi:hypothetical protein
LGSQDSQRICVQTTNNSEMMHHIRRTLLIQPGRNQTENEQMKNYERGRVVRPLDDVDVDER